MRVAEVGRLLLLCGLLVPLPARGESEFGRLNSQGEQAYQDGRYDDAANALQQAYAIKPVPALLFNIARCYEHTGNDDQAIRFYQRYLDAQGTDAETVKKSARALDLLRSRAAEKAMEKAKADEAAAKAAQDKAAADKAAADAAAAQAAQDKAAADKAAADKAAQDKAAQDRAQAGLAASSAPPPSRPSLVPGGVLAGVGAVAAAVGVGFGVSAQSQANAFNHTFDPVKRPQDKRNAQNQAHIADVCYASGVVVGGAGVALLIRALTSSEPSPAVPTALLAPHAAGLAWSGAW